METRDELRGISSENGERAIEVSITVPCHNEAGILEDNTEELIEYLEEIFETFEILLVENSKGSLTSEKASKIASEKEAVRHLHSENNGKGYAIEKGVRESRSGKVGFMDADLSTDIEHTEEAVRKLDQYDFVIGSRTKMTNRALSRKVPSLIFNKLLNTFFSSKIADHQCGFKFFRKDQLEEVMGNVRNKHFFWDAELLIKAQRNQISIYELEIEWVDEGSSTVNVFLDGLRFLKEIIRLKIEQVIE